MIYELREYTVTPGKMAALKQRFVDHAIPGWKRHGIDLVAFWDVEVGPNSGGMVVYLLQFPDMAARDKAWEGFRNDQVWLTPRAESEKNGPLVSRIDNRILKATPFSPMQ